MHKPTFTALTRKRLKVLAETQKHCLRSEIEFKMKLIMIKKLKEKRSTMLHLGDKGHRLLLASKLNLLLVPLTEETRLFKNP